jgi:hypothetical protein
MIAFRFHGHASDAQFDDVVIGAEFHFLIIAIDKNTWRKFSTLANTIAVYVERHEGTHIPHAKDGSPTGSFC